MEDRGGTSGYEGPVGAVPYQNPAGRYVGAWVLAFLVCIGILFQFVGV